MEHVMRYGRRCATKLAVFSRAGRSVPAAHVVFALVLGALALFAGGETAGAASSCASSGPAGGAYTVNVCLTAPVDGSTVNGPTAVTATVDATGATPGATGARAGTTDATGEDAQAGTSTDDPPAPGREATPPTAP